MNAASTLALLAVLALATLGAVRVGVLQARAQHFDVHTDQAIELSRDDRGIE